MRRRRVGDGLPDAAEFVGCSGQVAPPDLAARLARLVGAGHLAAATHVIGTLHGLPGDRR